MKKRLISVILSASMIGAGIAATLIPVRDGIDYGLLMNKAADTSPVNYGGGYTVVPNEGTDSSAAESKSATENTDKTAVKKDSAAKTEKSADTASDKTASDKNSDKTAETDAKADDKTDTKADIKADDKTDTKAEVKSEDKTVSEADTKTEAADKNTDKPSENAEVKTDAKTDDKADLKAEDKTDVKADGSAVTPAPSVESIETTPSPEPVALPEPVKAEDKDNAKTEAKADDKTDKTEETDTETETSPLPALEISNENTLELLQKGVSLSVFADGELDLTGGNVAITDSGEYTLSDYEGANSIVIGTDDKPVRVKLTIKGVSISSSVSPISVTAGSVLELTILGENSLTSTVTGYAGLSVNANTQNDETELIIDGTGSLTVKGGAQAAGIGGNQSGKGGSKGINGKITIKEGTITANSGGGNAGAGIGGSYSTVEKPCSDIVISGGFVTANGNSTRSAGIGGGYKQSNGKIYINGGTIIATGYSGIGHGSSRATENDLDNSIYYTAGSVKIINQNTSARTRDVLNSSNGKMTAVTLTMTDEEGTDFGNKTVYTGDAAMQTDADGKLYVYLPSSFSGSDSYSVNYKGDTYNIVGVLEDGNRVIDLTKYKEYTLEPYLGAACTCSPASDAGVTSNIPSSITVNKSSNSYEHIIMTEFKRASNCNFPEHKTTTKHTIAIDGVNGSDISDYAVISGNKLIVYYKAAEENKVIKFITEITYDKNTYTRTDEITVNGEEILKPDLSKGKIIISEADDKISVKVGSNSYTVEKGSEIHIIQSESKTSNTIQISADVEVVLEGLNVTNNESLTDIIRIGDGKTVTLKLSGTNSLKSTSYIAVGGVGTSSNLIIEGDGSLIADSSLGAGIGSIKSLTVNGGRIEAYGGSGGAGIGGGADGAGSRVTVNGGKVFAYGNGGGAGIGGGANSAGNGGVFIMNGGTVYAESDGGYGVGCGASAYNPGTITVNGGSLNATLKDQPTEGGVSGGATLSKNIFTLEGVEGEADVTYTINDGSSVKTSTDAEGKLYLYLKAGENWLKVTKGGESYYKYVKAKTVNSAAVNECIKNPSARIKSFMIPGEVEDAVIDQKNLTIDVTLPYNIYRDAAIQPTIEKEGCLIEPDLAAEGLDFSVQDTAEVTVWAENRQKVVYTVRLTLANEPEIPTADVFDISKGDIIIGSEMVIYGGVTYRRNDLGYIITGTSAENVITIEEPAGYNSDDNTITPIDITLKDLHITSTSEYDSPINLYAGADFKISGNCTIKSKKTPALYVEDAMGFSLLTDNKLSVNMTSADGETAKLVMSSEEDVAVDLNIQNGETMTVTTENLNVSFIGGENKDAFSETGEFRCDSVSYIRVVNNDKDTEDIQPTNLDGTEPVYQVALKINTVKKINSCEYNDIRYILGDDNTLYLMLPANAEKQQFSVVVDGMIYSSEDVVISGDTVVNIYTTTISSIEYNRSFTHIGGTAEITVKGAYLKNMVQIKLVRAETGESFPAVEKAGASDDTVVLEAKIPLNPSYNKEVRYSVFYNIIGDKDEDGNDIWIECSSDIVVSANTSVARMNDIHFAGQLGDAKFVSMSGDNIVNIYMPYDYVNEKGSYYTADNIDIIGSGVNPQENVPAVFTNYGNYVGAIYTVTAYDNKTTTSYIVRIYTETTPSVSGLSFISPDTPEGGNVEITIRGLALGNVRNAYNAENRKLCVYSEDGSIEPVEAEYEIQNGKYIYKATVKVPENISDTADAIHPIKVRIGNEVQNVSAQIRVPRRTRKNTNISSVNVDDQLGETTYTRENNQNIITIDMPYDADITSVQPSIILSDISSVYSPEGSQDFTSEKVYTVTAEDGVTTEDYIIRLNKIGEPVVSDIEFTKQVASAAGRIRVKLNGSNLENAATALNPNKNITVSADMIEGTGTSVVETVTASQNSAGDWIAYITVPRNEDSENAKKYLISVAVNGINQVLSDNELTVSRKLSNSNEITKFVLTEEEECTINSDNTIIVRVPYNTDLRALTPIIYHNGVNCVPSVPQNFDNCPVRYTVYAEDGTPNDYDVYVYRDGKARVQSIRRTTAQPALFTGGKVDFEVLGSFISTDSVNIYALRRGSEGRRVDAVITRDPSVYGGRLTASLDMPENLTSFNAEQLYDLYVNVNGEESTFGEAGLIRIPRRKTREFTEFSVELNGEKLPVSITPIGLNKSLIIIDVPYDYNDAKSLVPQYKYDGDSCTVSGDLDFYSPPTYTVSADGDFDNVYTVMLRRDGDASISKVSVSEMPDTYMGGDIDIEVEGIFYDTLEVQAVDKNTGKIAASSEVTVTEEGEAKATITLPKNEYTTAEAEYVLVFNIDNTEKVAYNSADVAKIAVPRRTTRRINTFYVEGQVDAKIVETGELTGEVTVTMPYEYKTISTPTLRIDGNDYTLSDGDLGFENSASCTVSAVQDTDRTYTVSFVRSGTPSISRSFIKTTDNSSTPQHYKDGAITVDFTGVFHYSAEVEALNDSGEVIDKVSAILDAGGNHASASLKLPVNQDIENGKDYTLRFKLDGFNDIEGNIGTITVPRKKTCQIDKFTLPMQEGKTIIDHDKHEITLAVPYVIDLTEVVPYIEYDADSITPIIGAAIDFSDDEHPAKITLNAKPDDTASYTVNIVKHGLNPQINSFVVPKQKEEAIIDQDNNTIYVRVTSGNVRELEPQIECSEEATFEPQGPQDFSRSKQHPIPYTITNQYGIQKTYMVTVDKPDNGSSAPITNNKIEISFDDTEIKAEVGDKLALEPKVKGTVIKPSYSTSNSKVAKVDQEGKVEIVGEGTAVIEAYIYAVKAAVTIKVGEDTAVVPTPVPHNGSYIIPDYDKAYISGYENGQFKPNNNITRAEIAAILARICVDGDKEYKTDYSDVSNDAWYADYVGYLQSNGIIKGYEDGTFRPEGSVTREELCAIVVRAMNCETSESEPVFSDVSAKDWASAYIMTLYDKGYINGYLNGTFAPKNKITRAEAVTIINHLVADGELVTDKKPTDVGTTFWAYDNIVKAMNDRRITATAE